MRISDWSSDVCSSDLAPDGLIEGPVGLDDKVMDSRLVGIDRDACHQIRMLNAGPGPGPIRPREGPAVGRDMHRGIRQEIGRASCRERGCQYVEISVGAVPLKKKNKSNHTTHNP